MKMLSLAGRNLKEGYRDPIVIILSVGQPVLFLFLFHFISGGDPKAPEIFSIPLLVPGIILFCFGFLTIFSGILLSRDRKSAFLLRLLAAPLKPADFILAYILPFLPIAFFQMMVCVIVGFTLGMPFYTGILLSPVVFIPAAIICISLGMIIGSIFSENAAPPAGSLVIFVITILGGVWMDLSMVGGFMEKTANILPFAPAVDAGRVLLSGGGFSEIKGEFYQVTVYMLIFLFLSVAAFRWRTKP